MSLEWCSEPERTLYYWIKVPVRVLVLSISHVIPLRVSRQDSIEVFSAL